MKKKYLLIIILIVLFLGIVSSGIVIGFWLLRRESETEKTDQSQNDSDLDKIDFSDTDDSEVAAPSEIIRIIFIHHSTGENWLADDNGGLGEALADNSYFVSDINYGWGPDSIGDTTDIGHWWLWFRGSESDTYLEALYEESEQNSDYTRLEDDPGGENEIIMFKSCYPNSALQGGSGNPVPDIEGNLLKGEDAYSDHHTVANAKGIYIDLLEYFKTKTDKLFVVVTAPPLSDSTYADNARTFNDWLTDDWLDDYSYNNVVVFDFFDVLADESYTLKYPSGEGDDHPSMEGNVEATTAFVQFLNAVYEEWKGNQ